MSTDPSPDSITLRGVGLPAPTATATRTSRPTAMATPTLMPSPTATLTATPTHTPIRATATPTVTATITVTEVFDTAFTPTAIVTPTTELAQPMINVVMNCPAQAVAGALLRCSLDYTNVGQTLASNLVAIVYVPDFTTFSFSTSDPRWQPILEDIIVPGIQQNESLGDYIAALDDLPVGAEASIRFALNINENAPDGNLLPLRALVRGINDAGNRTQFQDESSIVVSVGRPSLYLPLLENRVFVAGFAR